MPSCRKEGEKKKKKPWLPFLHRHYKEALKQKRKSRELLREEVAESLRRSRGSVSDDALIDTQLEKAPQEEEVTQENIEEATPSETPPPVAAFCAEIRDYRNEEGPAATYIGACLSRQIVPEPVVGKRMTTSNVYVDVNHMGMGDEVAETMASAISPKWNPKRLGLADNRLTKNGVKAIADSLMTTDGELDLNLSFNKIGCCGAYAVSQAIDDGLKTRLRVLALESCGLTSRGVVALVNALLKSQQQAGLTALNLSRNALDEASAEALANLCQSTAQVPHLTELRLAWADLRRRAAAAICKGIALSCVATADLSWNAWNDEENEAVAGLTYMLSTSPHLTHLDLSHSRIGSKEVEAIGSALEHNRALLGLHMKGNAGACNAYGFLEQSKAPETTVFEGHVFTRTFDDDKNWSASDKCWICQKWADHRFIFTPGLSDGLERTPEDLKALRVSLKADFDNFKAHPMRRVDMNTFELWRMVPPGTIYYSFLLSSVSPPSKRHKRPKATTSTSEEEECLARDQPTAAYDTTLMNTVSVQRKNGRQQQKSIALPRDVVDVKRVWTVKKSIFGQYKVDTATLVASVFDVDYAMTNLARVLCRKSRRTKGDSEDDDSDDNDRDSESAREVLRANYDVVKGAFKQFSLLSSSGDVFAMGWNALSEFAVACDLPEKKSLSRADIDMTFFTSGCLGPSSPKNTKQTLCRFQFLDAVVRLALRRFQGDSPAGAMRKLIDLMRDVKTIETAQSAADFHRRAWTQETDQLLRKHMDLLASVYAAYSGKDDKPGQPKFMSLPEWLSLLNSFMSDFSERDAKQAFSRAVQTVVDEMATEKHRRLAFLEFLKALVRLAGSLASSDDDPRLLLEALHRIIESLVALRADDNATFLS